MDVPCVSQLDCPLCHSVCSIHSTWQKTEVLQPGRDLEAAACSLGTVHPAIAHGDEAGLATPVLAGPRLSEELFSAQSSGREGSRWLRAKCEQGRGLIPGPRAPTQVPRLGWGQGYPSTRPVGRELERETPPGPLLQVGACGWRGWQGAVSVPGTSILQGPPHGHFAPGRTSPGAWLSECTRGWGRLTCAHDVCVCTGGGPASACR